MSQKYKFLFGWRSGLISRSLSPIAVWALSFGCAVGWGAFVMPGTTFLPIAGPLGTVIGIVAGAAIMLVIGANYHYMIMRYPDAGGTFTFARENFGYDHGFLCAWFLILVYISITWANATALPIIFRNMFGGLLQVGFHYQLAGYDVYLGEAMLSLAALFLFFFLCKRGGRAVGITLTVCAVIMLFGTAAGFITAVDQGHTFTLMPHPFFAPGKPVIPAILNIIALSPWAFVGFESVCHVSEETSFSPRKTLYVMIAAILSGSFCYIALSLMAVSVLPKGFSRWPNYIALLSSYNDIRGLPVFNAASILLGGGGTIIFLLTLLGAVFTGILGNSFVLSRLLMSLSRENMIPRRMEAGDKDHILDRIFPFLMLISIPIPFLGRSVIGWIVDINTIGASIAYLYTSLATYREASKENNQIVKITGSIGVICSVFFFMFFLIPNFSSVSTLSTESYMILIVWSIIGFMYFVHLFKNDRDWKYGNSTIVWIVLLFMIFFTTTLWTRQTSHYTTERVLQNLYEYNIAEFSERGMKLDRAGRALARKNLIMQHVHIHKSLMTNSIIQILLMMITLFILFRLYTLIMKRQKDASDELLKAKDDFMASMSHELRTPINSILGMNEMLLRETAENNTREYALNIQSSGRILVSLINDILDFSGIQAGKLVLSEGEYDLAVMVADIKSTMSGSARDKGIAFDVFIDENMPHVLYGDSIRLEQIILNLLSNAIKYTDQGAAILRVGFDETGSDYILLSISVEDTGIGIREEDQKKLFNAFERLDEGRNRTIEGTGLGMNIVQSLLKMMGSSLTMESVYGEGSIFSFTVKQKVLEWSPIEDFERFIPSASSDKYKVSFLAPEARILLVDDTEMNLLVVKGLLKNTQIKIDSAADGREGLDLTEENEYDLLLIDHRMPVMDGMEMLSALRSMEDNPNHDKPCISLTANAGIGARDEYLKAGFDDYLVKPVNGKRLEQTLAGFLPPEKVLYGSSSVKNEPAPDINVSDETPEDAGSESGQSETMDRLRDWGLNVSEGIEYAGDEDMYMFALQFFLDTIDAKRNEISGYYDSEDWENYITKVHGLKSSARVVGAEQLSEHARLIEISGKDGNFDYVHANHQSLLNEYNSYKELYDFIQPS